MLFSCKIANLLVLDNFDEEFRLLIRGVTKLDVSNCSMGNNKNIFSFLLAYYLKGLATILVGDDHEFLSLLITCAPHLKTLVLRGNNLSNMGLR